jgi:hypothetical protein
MLSGEGVFKVTPRFKKQGRPPTYYYASEHLEAVQAYWAKVEAEAAAAATAGVTSGRVVPMRRRGTTVATVEEADAGVGAGEPEGDAEGG